MDGGHQPALGVEPMALLLKHFCGTALAAPVAPAFPTVAPARAGSIIMSPFLLLPVYYKHLQWPNPANSHFAREFWNYSLQPLNSCDTEKSTKRWEWDSTANGQHTHLYPPQKEKQDAQEYIWIIWIMWEMPEKYNVRRACMHVSRVVRFRCLFHYIQMPLFIIICSLVT